MNPLRNMSMVLAVWLALGAGLAQADIFALKSGGQIRGELINADEQEPSHYTIHPYSGGEISIARGLITRVVEQRPLIEEYEKLKWQHPDTVEGNWAVAQWCRKKRLKEEREAHLHRILELDGDHREARVLLRYKLVDGVWKTRDEIELARGKVKIDGRWRYPEDIELEEQKAASAKQRREWFKTIKRWDSWLGSERSEQAKANILEIKDPAAVDALISRLEDADKLKIRKLYAKVLTSLGTKAATREIVDYSIIDDDREFRAHCFDMIEVYKPAPALDFYLKVLNSRKTTNRGINRAAIGLKYLGDKAAIPALIDRVTSVHRVKIGNGVTGSTQAGFSSGGNSGSSSGSSGTGFGTGQPTTRKAIYKNESVLNALIRLTEEDFGYDHKAWKTWYAKYKSEKKGPQHNPRRD